MVTLCELRPARGATILAPMTRLWGLGVFVVVALAFGLSSCGSSNGAAASCGTVQPCGGDPTGTWKIAASCSTSAGGLGFSDASCPTATASTSGLSVTGTYTFNADKTYAASITESGTVVATVPASCLSQGGLKFTCADLSALLQASSGMAGATFSAASCTGTSGCTCTLTNASTTMSQAGTWEGAGTSIVLTLSDGSTGGGPYCVQGDTIHLLDVDMMTVPMGPMGTAKVIDDIVATKQ
jgi:hypothetical protein